MQEINKVIANKLTLAQYRQLKASGAVNTDECYVISDIDTELDNIVTYKESLSVNAPIILRSLETGMYKIYGYFKYYDGYSGISGADPFAYVIAENYGAYSYVSVISTIGVNRYKITDDSHENLDDSGWIQANIESGFENYSSNGTVEYRKKNGIVEIRGAVKPTEAITASATPKTMFALPDGYKPSKQICKVCQGSGRNVWLITINTNGTVGVSRYGATENIDIPVGAWLAFDELFMV